MIGYYVCKMVGTGSEENPYRPYVIDVYRVSMTQVGVIGKGCLCFVADPPPELDDDPQVYPLPKDPTASFTRDEWARATSRLQGFGLSPSDYDPQRTVKEFVEWVGKQYEPMFNINHFRAGVM